MPSVLLAIILLLSILATACGQEVSSNNETQLRRGETVYAQSCATSTCHGIHGEGILDGNEFRVWPLVGKEFRKRNPTAQVIFDVVRSGRESPLRMLTDQQIYDAIAYELSLNSVSISETLTFQNASTTYSGNFVNTLNSGSIYPPPRDANLVSDWSGPTFPVCGENQNLRLCVTQLAAAASIEDKVPLNGGRFVLIVAVLEVLADHSLTVQPEYLGLVNKDGQKFEPLDINLNYPIARFGTQTIEPEHSTSFLSIFALPEFLEISYLLYTQPDEQWVLVNLTP